MLKVSAEREMKLMGESHKYVLTGGPGAGKTTVIQAIEKQGHSVMHEVARALIEEQLASGGEILPWKNRDSFQQEILSRRLALETREEQSDQGIVFLDRAIPDGIAYYVLEEIDPPADLLETANEASYRGVFILESVDDIQTSDREQNFWEDPEIIQNHIIQVYEALGYSPIFVPRMSVPDRIRFILDHVQFHKDGKKIWKL